MSKTKKKTKKNKQIQKTSCDAFCDLRALARIKNLKNTSRGVFFSLQLHLKTCNFIKNNTPPQMFLKFRNEANNFKSQNASNI